MSIHAVSPELTAGGLLAANALEAGKTNNISAEKVIKKAIFFFNK
ncbi:hypothetical protein QS257_18105 [Terrilactibacillus sp. S3-3]|nr:hypothetical protein QS257_18105 [Terrilactibacillus sp. S3-3]